ncbi:FG-GAP repeat domain-containing protein [Polyangium jinanense]|uniref:VCBS repeat-containing protein n=1 Tax=Polyangium jinanense TaxID=2829994 RepID=A0A9X3WZF9_9BACT|nr:VCBS repeat-containing protein [Polyangium jinanense]MDC3980035.1 VCBS repeat-containing protein [Polyangium jinanense]
MRRRFAFLVLSSSAATLLAALGQGCGGGGSSSSGGTGAAGSGSTTGTGGMGGSSSGTGGDDTLFDAGSCPTGEACDGGVCAGGVCCAVELACGEACCGGGEVCSFQKCVTPGASCAESGDCAAGEYCELSLGDPQGMDGGVDAGCMGGAQVPSGKCLPKPPTCAPGMPPPKPGDPLTCLESCQYKPAASTFAPELKFAWGGQLSAPFSTDVMMSPIVIELDDDDCDGKVTAKDIPEIVFATFTGGAYQGAGMLHAISVVGGQVVEKWAAAGIHPTKQLAAGNIDGAAGNEVVACAEGADAGVRALKGDGSLLWATAPMRCFMPTVADLDGDGTVEVVVEGGILDGVTGAVKASFSAELSSSFVVSDVTGDGVLDIVTGSQVFDAAGMLLLDTGTANQSNFYATQDWKSPWPAVADFDADGKPEVVVVDNLNHALVVWRYDAAAPGKFTIVRPALDINGTLSPSLCPAGSWGNTHGGGPPTIADFNGDGTPDVAMAGGVGYAVLDGKKLVDAAVPGSEAFLWIKQTSDCSSASTGSTVFDFDGDGKAEVVYSDQQRLRVYEGPTGNVLWERCNTTATLIENPVVADVDNDGHADIVAVSNAYGQASASLQCDDGVSIAQSGVRIFGDTSGKWVRTRRVWNEHAYHITNVEEDGTIPTKELPNYLQPGLNNFRQNKQPGSEFAAPDAVVSLVPVCVGPYGLVAVVRNVGEASLPAGVVVGFYKGNHPNGELLGQGTTSKVLYAAESESVLLPLPGAPGDVTNGAAPIYAVVDDTSVPHPAWTECRTDNNVSAPASGACNSPK